MLTVEAARRCQACFGRSPKACIQRSSRANENAVTQLKCLCRHRRSAPLSKVNICALFSPPRGPSTSSGSDDKPFPLSGIACRKRQRGITANKRYALRGLMNRKNQRRSKLRGMNPVAIQKALITCSVKNEGSRKVIEKCGGLFERTTDYPDLDVQECRNWIHPQRQSDAGVEPQI